MSGTHDVAKDAVQKLLDGCRYEADGGHAGYLIEFRDDIHTLARYLGVDLVDEEGGVHEHTFEVAFSADHEVKDEELYRNLGRMPGVRPGSQRCRRVRHAR